MPGSEDADVTGLLAAWGHGDTEALHALMPLVERDLRRIARRCLRGERTTASLPPTALVNEAFLRLVELNRMAWHDRAHFFAMAARLMRRVLVDLARARRAAKRGGGEIHVNLAEADVGRGMRQGDVLRLDEALHALAAIDERKCRVVELRVFAGLSAEETALALQISAKTALRDWAFAKAWLQRELGRPGGS